MALQYCWRLFMVGGYQLVLQGRDALDSFMLKRMETGIKGFLQRFKQKSVSWITNYTSTATSII